MPAAIKCGECEEVVAKGRFQNGRVVPPEELVENGGDCPQCGADLDMDKL